MSWPTKFQLNPISGLGAKVQRLLNQSEAKYGGNLAEHDQKLTRYVDGMWTFEVTTVTWYIHPPYHGHAKVMLIVMNDPLTFLSMSIGPPTPEIKLFQTLNLQGQGHR